MTIIFIWDIVYIIPIITSLSYIDILFMFFNRLVTPLVLIIYFSIVYMRLYKNKGNISTAKNILVICYASLILVRIVWLFIPIYFGGIGSSIISIILSIFSFIYFYTLLIKSKPKINNIIFVIVIIGYTIYLNIFKYI